MIDLMPDGVNSIIEEGGSNLSGGQKQRIALARGVYQDRPIIILDEATSAIDKKTEMIILNNLESKIDNSTILMVTHNKHIQQFFKKTYEIKDGNLKMAF